MKDLQAIRGAKLLRQWIAQGEHQTQDFKFVISDACKIARSLSAFANRDGGRLLIGVKDNGIIAGVRNEEDIYVVEQAAERYCYPSQQVTFNAYRIDGPIHVIVATIKAADSRPVYAIESDGSRRAYYRVADENIAAHPLLVRAWERKSNTAGRAIALSGIHTDMLGYIGRHESITDTRRIALDLHISTAATEQAIVDLAALELIQFTYTNGHFGIK